MNPHQKKGTAVITGASTGIGAVYADRLAQRGYDLVLVARNVPKLTALADRLSHLGRKISIISCDLTDTNDLLKVEQILKDDMSISMLVNNAGLGSTAKFSSISPQAVDDMIRLNVIALTKLTLAVSPGMVRRGKGIVVNIASIVALAPEMMNGIYGGSKAYVLALTQSMHHELGASGIQVQAVLPGATGTTFWGKAGTPVEHLPDAIVMTPENVVDAALAGLDMSELITIPSLPNISDWEMFEKARIALSPNLSRVTPAPRYKLKG